MAKKKDKPQVINNIQELNLEIDYDKLAEAMIKAQEKSETVANKNPKYTSSTFALLISITFRIVAVIGWLLTITIPIAVVNIVGKLVWNNVGNFTTNIISIAIIVVIGVAIGVYSFFLWKSAKEIEAEKDRNYIISVFSGIVSFAALIVALVALFKGVG